MTTQDVVREDLKFLADNFETGDVTSAELRRASVVVRRLLNDSQLPQALAQLGRKGSLRLEAFPIDQVLPSGSTPRILLAMAGGSRFQTRQFGPTVIADIATPVPATFVREQYTLSAYLSAECLVADEQPLTRRTLVKYLANKLGGAHYDNHRQANERDMVSLDKLAGLAVDGFHPAFLELLAIIQALIASPSAMEPFGLSPRPTALFDTLTGKSEGPVKLVKRAYNNLDRLADLRDA